MNPQQVSPMLVRLLVVICVLQGITLLAVLTARGPALLPAASAQMADPGVQRTAIADAQAGTNARLDKIIELLQSGQLQVRIVKADDAK